MSVSEVTHFQPTPWTMQGAQGTQADVEGSEIITYMYTEN